MHSSPPNSTPAKSPTSDCKWKRGRPVPARSSLIHQGSSVCTPVSPAQLVTKDGATLGGGQGHIRQTSTSRQVEASQAGDAESSSIDAAQRMRLWDSSKALRFAPTISMEVDHSTFNTMTAGRMRKLSVNVQDTANHFSTDARTVRSNEIDHALDHKQVEILPGSASDLPPERDPSSQVSTSTAQSSDSEDMADKDSDIASEQDGDIQSCGGNIAEEHVPLAFQIPEDTLRAAMMASSNTRGSYWSTKLYRGPQGEALPTHYCTSIDVAERVAQYFLKEKVVGFDIEWRPRGNPFSIKQNASLVQLACGDRIALFHIALFSGSNAEQLMPPSLKAVLESPEIFKVGVAVKGDFTRLEKYLGVHAQGVFELSRLHNLVEWYQTDPSKVSNRLVSLAVQVLQHLQLPLYKGEQLDDDPDITSSVRESDWSQPLDLQQIHYAAADAYAGFRLYHVLEWKRKQLRPIAPAIQLCDYDAKSASRPKEARKKTKTVDKPRTNIQPVTEQTAGTGKQGQEEVEEEEDYETAPEELMDSHELEAPVLNPMSTASTEAVDKANDDAPNLERDPNVQFEFDHKTAQTHKRVGRIDLSHLRGPDPVYAALPQDSIENGSRPSSVSFDHCSSTLTDGPPDKQVDGTQSPVPDIDIEGDEFADSELEEALRVMVLDCDGKLTNDRIDAALESKPEKEEGMTADALLVDIVQEDHKAVNEITASGQESDQVKTIKPLDVSLVASQAEDINTPTCKPLAVGSEEASRTHEYHLATTWSQEYLQSTIPSRTSTAPSRIRATVPHLRAYHLWRHQKLSLAEIGKHLREPPLSHSTVSSYVLQAISLEGLEYETEELKDLMMAMQSGLRRGRWKGLAEKVGALD
ncbi:Nn.00g098560.m01.CDS01 [Neocucurbitaria sp. VM-36]